MIKLVAFDLDGTRAESKQPIKPDMSEALSNLRRRRRNSFWRRLATVPQTSR